jgi:hypothetical protein
METEVTNCHYVELPADYVGIRGRKPGDGSVLSIVLLAAYRVSCSFEKPVLLEVQLHLHSVSPREAEG